MKNITSTAKIFAMIMSVAFLSSMLTLDASAQGVFQKRKHRKGFYINLGKDKAKKQDNTAEVVLDETKQVELEIKPTVVVEDQAYELALETETVAENLPVAVEPAAEAKKSTLNKTVDQLGLKDKAENTKTIAQNQLDKWNKVKTKATPYTNKQTELDPMLRKAIILVAVGLILEIIAGIIAAVTIFGLAWLIYLVGAILIVIGLVYFILWLVDNI